MKVAVDMRYPECSHMLKSFSAILKQDAIFHHFITQAYMETMQLFWWKVLCDVQRCCSMGFTVSKSCE